MLDSYGRSITYLRLSVTELCNLRCRYCMPVDGICKKAHEEMLSEEEMILAVRVAADLGVTKLRITGGEPLVKRNILSICSKAAAVPGIREVCLTTNATLLSRMALQLREAGVKRLNISLDTLNAEKYAYITCNGSLDDALRGIETALNAGFERIKLNTVLIGGFNDDEIPALSALTRRWPVDVRFIELMPMYDGEFGPQAFIPCSAVLDALPELVEQPADGGVAQLYRDRQCRADSSAEPSFLCAVQPPSPDGRRKAEALPAYRLGNKHQGAGLRGHAAAVPGGDCREAASARGAFQHGAERGGTHHERNRRLKQWQNLRISTMKDAHAWSMSARRASRAAEPLPQGA